MERYLPVGLELPIIPNYELPFEEVYISTTFYLLQNMSNIFILSCVEDKTVRNYHTLPSWVPDYSSELTEIMTINNTGLKWKAYGFCSSPLDSRKLSGRVLELPGAHFDTSESISIPLKLGGHSVISDLAEFVKESSTMCSHPDAFPVGWEHEPRIISFAMTLLVGDANVLGYQQANAPRRPLFSGMRGPMDSVFRIAYWAELSVVFRAVSAIVFFATSITRHPLSSVVLPAPQKF